MDPSGDNSAAVGVVVDRERTLSALEKHTLLGRDQRREAEELIESAEEVLADLSGPNLTKLMSTVHPERYGLRVLGNQIDSADRTLTESNQEGADMLQTLNVLRERGALTSVVTQDQTTQFTLDTSHKHFCRLDDWTRLKIERAVELANITKQSPEHVIALTAVTDKMVL